MSEELLTLAREQIEAYNAGDWDRLRGAITPSAVYEEPATQRRIEGADAIVEAYQGWKAAFPDSQGSVTGGFASGDRVALEVTWKGTHTGPLHLPGGGAVPPTGRSFNVQALQVLRMEDGKVAENRQCFDLLGLLEQLGTLSAETLAPAG